MYTVCRDGAVKSKGNKVEEKTQKKTNLIQKEGGERRQEFPTSVLLTIKCVEQM